MPKECDFIKAISEILFRAIGILFSAVLLIFSLLSSIDLNAQGDKLSELKTELRELKEENRYLQAELEAKYSLSNIERYAREVLGMRPCRSEQIEYIDLPGEG